MVDTIGPMVRADRREGFQVKLAHVGGGLLGGGLTGFALGASGSFVSSDPMWGLAAIAGVALVWDLVRDGKKLGTPRQTPRSWRYLLPPRLVSFLNGFDLGLGWSTRIYFVSYLVAMIAAFFSAHAVAGALIGAAFGGSRAATVVLIERRGRGAQEMAATRRTAVAMNALALGQFAVTTVAVALLG